MSGFRWNFRRSGIRATTDRLGSRPNTADPHRRRSIMPISSSLFRRFAFASSAAVVLVTAATTMRAGVLDAKPKPAASKSVEPSNKWLLGLKAKHKQFFDNPAPNGGIALVHV